MLEVKGLLEHLPIAVALLGLGWLTVNRILKAWRSLLDTMEGIVTAAIDVHVKERHHSDEAWRTELRAAIAQVREEQREGLVDLRNDIRAVHARIDRHMERKRYPDDSSAA